MITSHKQVVLFKDLGRQEYRETWEYQEKLLQENVGVKAALRNRQLAIDNKQLAKLNPSTLNF